MKWESNEVKMTQTIEMEISIDWHGISANFWTIQSLFEDRTKEKKNFSLKRYRYPMQNVLKKIPYIFLFVEKAC